jgi:fumarylacetoacetase
LYFQPTRRVGAAIGDYILDIALLEARGLFTACILPDYAASLSQPTSSFAEDNTSSTSPKNDRTGNPFIFNQFTLNAFAAMPSAARSAVRKTIIALLSDGDSVLFQEKKLNAEAFFQMQDAQMHLPMHVGDFSDFMCARTHVDNVSLLCILPSLLDWLKKRKMRMGI